WRYSCGLLITALATLSTIPAQAITFSGTATGTWGDPIIGNNTTPVFSGVGTNAFSWGVPALGFADNELGFQGLTFNTGPDVLFPIGNLTYFNGTIQQDTGVDGVSLSIDLAFATPEPITQVFNFDFAIITTPNIGTPAENADSLLPVATFGDRIITVGGEDYTLQLTGFSQDGGLTSSPAFSVLEETQTTATLYGRLTPPPLSAPILAPSPGGGVSTPGSDTAIPEPSFTLGLGLVALYGLVKKLTGKR
ncbi:MAG: hypothetical protein F6K09_32255, partial [Merismopedia sp. SIO2A8]|nr:hypothetical protein [Merismopedia sp. SIO2A8]